MRLYNISGRLCTRKSVSKYRIDWDGKSRSKFQAQVKKLLSKAWGSNIVYEEFPVYGTRYSIDFFNATKMMAIEVQGEQHTKFVKFFHNGNHNQYLNQILKDERKRDFCEKNDINLIEIFWEEKKKLNLRFLKKLGV